MVSAPPRNRRVRVAEGPAGRSGAGFPRPRRLLLSFRWPGSSTCGRACASWTWERAPVGRVSTWARRQVATSCSSTFHCPVFGSLRKGPAKRLCRAGHGSPTPTPCPFRRDASTRDSASDRRPPLGCQTRLRQSQRYGAANGVPWELRHEPGRRYGLTCCLTGTPSKHRDRAKDRGGLPPLPPECCLPTRGPGGSSTGRPSAYAGNAYAPVVVRRLDKWPG